MFRRNRNNVPLSPWNGAPVALRCGSGIATIGASCAAHPCPAPPTSRPAVIEGYGRGGGRSPRRKEPSALRLASAEPPRALSATATAATGSGGGGGLWSLTPSEAETGSRKLRARATPGTTMPSAGAVRAVPTRRSTGEASPGACVGRDAPVPSSSVLVCGGELRTNASSGVCGECAGSTGRPSRGGVGEGAAGPACLRWCGRGLGARAAAAYGRAAAAGSAGAPWGPALGLDRGTGVSGGGCGDPYRAKECASVERVRVCVGCAKLRRGGIRRDMTLAPSGVWPLVWREGSGGE